MLYGRSFENSASSDRVGDETMSEVVEKTKISCFLICSLNPNIILTFAFKVKLPSVHNQRLPALTRQVLFSVEFLKSLYWTRPDGDPSQLSEFLF